MKATIDTSRLRSGLWRGWWIIALSAVIAGAAAFAYSGTLTPLYQSSASTYFSMRSGTSGSDINQGSTYTQNQMLSFAQLAMSSVVLDPVRQDVNTDLTNAEIRRMTSVSVPQNTVILEVKAKSSDPKFSAAVANSISKHLVAAVEKVAPKDDSGKATVGAMVVDPAIPAAFQSSPDKRRDALLGGIAGALLASFVIAVWSLVDTRVRNEGALRRVTDLPVLGRIPGQKDAGRRPIVALDPNGTSAEAYRAVRSALRFTTVGKEASAILVTSSIPGEGKTTTAINVALAYAEAGARVLLVDADLRRPTVAESLGLENRVGLTSVLLGAATSVEAALPWGTSGLMVLPAGEVPPNPAEFLASERMTQLLGELRVQFDVVVLDAAPILSVADATILAQSVDTTLVVVDVSRAKAPQLTRALEAMEGVHADVAGVLLSRVKRAQQDKYHYSYEGVATADDTVALPQA